MEVIEKRIASSDDAWDMMRSVLQGDILKESFELVFDDWPKIEIKFNGEDWNQTIPTRIMPAMLDMQKEIYRTYAMIHYGEANTRRLTEKEREDLEIILHVAKGSTEIEAQLKKLFSKIAEGAISKMEAKHYLILLLGVGVLISGGMGWKDWIELKAKEIDAKTQVTINKQNVDAQSIMSEQETKRLDIFREAIQQVPGLGTAKESFEEIRNKQLRALKPQDRMTIEGVEVNGVIGSQLSHKPRKRSDDKRIDSDFRISTVDTGIENGYKVKLHEVGSHLEFVADVSQLSDNEWDALKNAIWNKEPIKLQVNAKELRGEITSATVVAVVVI